MIDKKNLNELINFNSKNNPVTTAYISVDNSAENRKNHLINLKKLIKYKKSTSYFKELSEKEQNSVLMDFKKINEWITNSFDSKKYNSAIIFASNEEGLWHTLPLKHKLQNRIEIHTKPYIRPLTELFEESKKYAVVLIDRSKGRIFECIYGEYSEYYSVKENVDIIKTSGFEGSEERKVERSNQKVIKEHYKDIANKIFELNKVRNFNWIIIGGRKESVKEFEENLHDYVASKVSDRIIIDPSANIKDVFKKVKETEKNAREKFELNYIDQILEKMQSNFAITGVENVIKAAEDKQIDTLFVKDNFSPKGVFCRNDDFISGELLAKCPKCGSNLERTDDLVEHILHSSLNQSAKIKYVNGTLDQYGKIAAFLRFPKVN